ETDGAEIGRAGAQLAAWLSGSGSAGHHLVLNAILLLPPVVAALLPRADRPLRALAWMALAQHAVMLFFHPFYRYAALACLPTLLVDLALLQRGLALVSARRRGDRPAEEPSRRS